MERCVRCGIEGDKVRLFDGIYDGRVNPICERCSIIENITIIKKPNSSQLKEAERGEEVYKRMKRLSGIDDRQKKETFFVEDRLKRLDAMPELELPERRKLNLIEHFHWEIMRNRRRKGLSQEKLAAALGESLTVVQMLERGKIPEGAEGLIRKIEQFFQINLRKISEMDRIIMEKRRTPVLLDEKGNEIDIIPEDIPENTDIEIIEYGEDEIDELEKEQINLKGVDFEKGELDLTSANLDRVKISDLRELNRRKVEATKQEKIEEAKRIDERRRLVEARKEELRLLKEKESKEIDKVLGGEELLKRKDDRDEYLNLD